MTAANDLLSWPSITSAHQTKKKKKKRCRRLKMRTSASVMLAAFLNKGQHTFGPLLRAVWAVKKSSDQMCLESNAACKSRMRHYRIAIIGITAVEFAVTFWIRHRKKTCRTEIIHLTQSGSSTQVHRVFLPKKWLVTIILVPMRVFCFFSFCQTFLPICGVDLPHR